MVGGDGDTVSSGSVGIGEFYTFRWKCVCRFEESRMQFADPTKLDRKSGGSGGICGSLNQHLLRIEAAEDLLASPYAAVSCSFAMDLRCDCAGVPGGIVCPDTLVNDGAL
jgi:hypothetical protein